MSKTQEKRNSILKDFKNLLIKIGVQNLILCPGSRSAPLAIAAGELNKLGLVNIC